MRVNSTSFNIRTLDQLIDRDKLRELDGFPRKIRIGRMVRPGRNSEGKVVVIPTTVEEKFFHDNRFDQKQEGESSGGGSGEGEEGEVIGEGWHERAGSAHAERAALSQAGSDAAGATVYVTLEPCSFEGRTGACTTALIQANG